MAKNPKQAHANVAVDAETLSRKKALPAFYSWRDIVKRGLLVAEGEQLNINSNRKEGK